MDFSKYDPLHHKDAEFGLTSADYDDHSKAPGSEPWMSSTRVIKLVEFLRKNHDKGIILYERYGTFCLKFNPGINAADLKNGRATIAMNAFTLLADATRDMKDMISSGISIPLLTRKTNKNGR